MVGPPTYPWRQARRGFNGISVTVCCVTLVAWERANESLDARTRIGDGQRRRRRRRRREKEKRGGGGSKHAGDTA
jgi:hypothetical protein